MNLYIPLGRLVSGGVPYVCLSAIAPVFACSFMVQPDVIDSVYFVSPIYLVFSESFFKIKRKRKKKPPVGDMEYVGRIHLFLSGRLGPVISSATSFGGIPVFFFLCPG